MPDHGLVSGTRVYYSRQYRRCTRPGCPSCTMGGPGHGPYWYAHWREGGRQRSRYLGKDPPPEAATQALPEDVRAAPRPEERAAPRAAAALRVRTLGGLEVWRGGANLHVETWRPRTAPTLFACLLEAPGHRLRREELAELLWPEEQPGNGLRNLRGAIYYLRRHLGQGGTREGYLLQEGAFLCLAPAPGGDAADDWLDALAFERLAAGALAGRDPSACRAALARYTGDYLPEEPYAEWAAATREKLAHHRLAVLLHLAALCRAEGEVGEAESHLHAALAADPCHEEAATALMELLAARGRRGEALQVYQKVAAALDRELGLGPQAALEGLRARLLAEAATPTAADFAPRLRLPGRASNLPSPLSSFVGRVWELAEVRSALQGTRLLTLVGPGGCGKSRLAQEAAGALLSDYPDGVWLVELAALVDPALVPQATAAALGVAERADQSRFQVLADFLAPRALLLLLDNCEHLLAACAALAEHLLQHCPHLRILATSRQALGPAGEVAWLVPALAYPEVGAVPAATDLAGYEAVQLFVARARAQRPAFALSDANAGAVARICGHLDGMPLALELAAARLGALSVAEVAGRLGDRFALLSGGSRMALPRQRTLRATLDWSWELLGEGERRLLRRLAVFAGGWTLEAAEAVCAAEHLPAGEVLDLLAELVAKSLVQVTEREGRSRYGLLETVRQYARERLEASDEINTLHDRHLTYYLAEAERAEPQLTGREQGVWLDRLEAEHDNLRAALAWAEAQGRVSMGLRLTGALWRFWFAQGHLSEGRSWCAQLLDRDGREAAGDVRHWRAKTLVGAAGLAYRQQDLSPATMLAEEGRALHHELGDPQGRANALAVLALIAHEQGDLRRARQMQVDILALRRALQDPHGTATTLGNLALTQRELGEYADAVALNEESLAIGRAQGFSDVIAHALNSLGMLAWMQGDLARAEALNGESLALAHGMGAKSIMGYALTGLGTVALTRGRYDEARQAYQESLTLRRELGETPGVAGAHINLGNVACRQGQYAEAGAHYRAGLTIYGRNLGNRNDLAECLQGLAEVWCAQGQPDRAAWLLGVIAGLYAVTAGVVAAPEQRTEHERITALVRGMLGASAFDAGLAAGRALPLEEAVALARDTDPPR